MSALYASTTPRASETAQIIGGKVGLAAQQRPALRVPDAGAAEGHVWADARERWPLDPHNLIRALPDDAEPWPTYLDRAAADLDEILHQHLGGRIVIVGHTETVSAMYAPLLGVHDLGRLKVDLGHCEVSVWRAVGEWPGAQHNSQRWSLRDLMSTKFTDLEL
ncbi:histidine phosphatase family protein [Dactylosporangium sp. NPDC051485]|uniref:histidine phosphatase family protein n=1 Tax=Dactylosporangium sp. NPDC051485 TaxID=3154846 RepID=UPI00341C03C5